MKHRIRLAAVAVVIASGWGCIGVRGREFDETRHWPPSEPAAAKKPSVKLSVVGKATLNRKPLQISPQQSAGWLQAARATYASSGLFSEVSSGDGAADVLADLEVLDAGSGSKFMWFMTGFTLGLIPSSATDSFTWKTTFRDGSGGVRGVIEKQGSATMWMEILLIFGLPFATPGDAVQGTLQDLNRSTIHDALEKGYLHP